MARSSLAWHLSNHYKLFVVYVITQIAFSIRLPTILPMLWFSNMLKLGFCVGFHDNFGALEACTLQVSTSFFVIVI